MTMVFVQPNARLDTSTKTHATLEAYNFPASSAGSCLAPADGRSWPVRHRKVSLVDETQ